MTARRLTIFEGPDGSGKTTAAKTAALNANASYVHLGPLLRVHKHLAGFYVDAMLPALLGYQEVVMDRSWLSERPYGLAFRGGKDRLGLAQTRMLERLALRCGGSLIVCAPPLATCIANVGARGEKVPVELAQVHNHYVMRTPGECCLPSEVIDYTRKQSFSRTEATDPIPHPTRGTAGNWDAAIVLVGEAFGEPKEGDRLYQWPFVSFSPLGCSVWLTEQLEFAGVGEDELLWVNADQLLDSQLLDHLKHKTVIALGKKAARALASQDVTHFEVPHPQSWKRFHSGDEYPLHGVLKEVR